MSSKANLTYSDIKPSEMFLNSLLGGGASSIYCSCGRMHYAPRNLIDSEDETDYPNILQCIEEEKKADPDGVIINYEDDFVYAKNFDGKVFVVDCPCNGLKRYEDWIWDYRNSIREYLKVRIEQEYIWAQQELTLNKLAGISK